MDMKKVQYFPWIFTYFKNDVLVKDKKDVLLKYELNSKKLVFENNVLFIDSLICRPWTPKISQEYIKKNIFQLTFRPIF